MLSPVLPTVLREYAAVERPHDWLFLAGHRRDRHLTTRTVQRQVAAAAGTVDLAADPRVAYLLIESEQIRWRVTLHEAVARSPVSGSARD